jgi:MerR family transcriptional regulator, light-induced transcriptional regulator
MKSVPDVGLSAGEAARRIGVAATTLRTWDRRYGLGPSCREPGRHRRYSEDDLARLKLMRRLTVEGVAPAEAARIARATGDPAGQVRDPAGQVSAGAPGQPPPDAASPGAAPRPDAASPGPTPRTASVRPPASTKGLRRAALALDPAAVDRVLNAALAEGVVPAWTTVVAPALRSLGRQYLTAGRYIAAEHLLSGAVSTALARVPRPQAWPRIVLACAPSEQHCLPLEALAAALAERGVTSRMLGARMPTDALREALIRTGPAAALIWAHSPATADYGQLAAIAGIRPRPAVVAACGPGWAPASLPDGILLLTTFEQALSVATRLP